MGNQDRQEVFIGWIALDTDFEGTDHYWISDVKRIESLKEDLLKTLEKYELETYISTFGIHAFLDWC